MGEFSLIHWVVVGGIALLFFGPKKLPELGKGLGEAIRGFKKGLNEEAPKETEKLAEPKSEKEKSDS
jgi:sec-independent protein translocase protein TatA